MSKVLVVDDEKSIRITLCEFLKKEGYEADFAVDAVSAFQMMEDKDYDVIITDIIMPHISGIDMLPNIREQSQSIQIIVMTGEPTVDTAIKAVHSGANDYITKPINKEILLKTVHRAAHIKNLYDDKQRLEEQNQLYQKDLEEMVERKTQSLQNAMQSIVYVLSSVVEIRDPYTAGHQRKVGNLAVPIAKKLGYDRKTIDCLRVTGYIHDIGKIVIPSEILTKPGKLSNLEMEMIRNHSQQGYEMLSKVDLPYEIAEIVYQHHERLDGSGYPRGLKANEILDEANIIVVADVVEAMMSHRPYRPALGIDVALDEIKKNAGKLYKPDVVDACVELFTKDNYKIDDTEYKIQFPL